MFPRGFPVPSISETKSRCPWHSKSSFPILGETPEQSFWVAFARAKGRLRKFCRFNMENSFKFQKVQLRGLSVHTIAQPWLCFSSGSRDLHPSGRVPRLNHLGALQHGHRSAVDGCLRAAHTGLSRRLQLGAKWKSERSYSSLFGLPLDKLTAGQCSTQKSKVDSTAPGRWLESL